MSKTTHRILMEDKLIPILRKEKCGSVLDVGSKDARYKKYMSCSLFKSLDIEKGCDIQADIQDYKSEEKYDTITCFQVLEHVEHPQLAVDSMYDLLDDKGVLVLSVPLIFQVHAEQDYWRFTEQALRLLCKNFKTVKIIAYGNFLSASWGLFHFHNKIPFVNWFVSLFGRMFKDKCPDGYIVVATK